MIIYERSLIDIQGVHLNKMKPDVLDISFEMLHQKWTLDSELRTLGIIGMSTLLSCIRILDTSDDKGFT